MRISRLAAFVLGGILSVTMTRCGEDDSSVEEDAAPDGGDVDAAGDPDLAEEGEGDAVTDDGRGDEIPLPDGPDAMDVVSDEEPDDGPAEIANCAWLFPYRYLPWEGRQPGGLGNEFEDPQFLIDNLEGTQLDCLIVHGGEWQADGSISRDPGVTPALWTNFTNEVKTWNPDMKVLVWATTIGGSTTDLSDSSKREAMYDSVRTLLDSAPFDGYNEDYEGWSGDLAYLRTFYEGIISTVKGMGKLATVATEVEWGTYHIEDYTELLEGFDCNMPMYYGHIKYYDSATWNKILEYSPCPVSMGLSIWDSVRDPVDSGITFAQQLAWVDTQSHENLAGIAVWSYDQMSIQDVEDLKAWTGE
jgi:hypothetical protein